MNKDELAFLEAAYQLDASPNEWLESLSARWGAALQPRPEGLGGWQYELEQIASLGFQHPAVGETQVHHQLDEDELQRAAKQVPPSVAFALCDGDSCGTLATKVEDDPRLGNDTIRGWQRAFAAVGARDAIGFVAVTPRKTGILMVALYERTVTFNPVRAKRWLAMAAHVGIAQQLRAGLCVPSPMQRASAILTPTGKRVDAKDSARDPKVQSLLNTAVQTVERARTRRGMQHASDDLLKLWDGLLNGKWSLLHQTDSDGRRYYVMVETPPKAVPLHRLSALERAVLQRIAQGLPNKFVAYELGLPTSTVANSLASGLRKMRIPSKFELIRMGALLANTTE